MASSTPSPNPSALPRGTYSHGTPSDLRSPCPLVNSLANHGYIARDGRNIRVGELRAAAGEVGLSAILATMLTHPIFSERQDQPEQQQGDDGPQKPRSFLGKALFFIRNPWAILLPAYAMRRPGQVDAAGKPCLNLDQLGLPGAVEHDVSLTRRDHQQGDNLSPQPDLIEALLGSSSDGGKTLSAKDLADLRRRRIERQREDNPGLTYGPRQHTVACSEIAIILEIFGDGDRLPCERARAFFLEERLPVQEGWKKRGWWRSLGFLGLKKTSDRIKKLIGLAIE